MPTIITRGAASARGFGFGASAAVCAKDGTIGIFQLGNTSQYNPAICASCFYTSDTRDKYTYSTDSSITSGVGTSSVKNNGGAAAGNSTRGIFTIANTFRPVSGAVGGPVTTRNKYTYATCTSTACGVAAASTAGVIGHSATGNSTRGIFQIGGGTTRNKYTYACCTSTASGVGASGVISYYGSAAGNSTRGIFAAGSTSQNCVNATTRREKYTYACCTSTACGVAQGTYQSWQGGAAGNSTRGIFVLSRVNVFCCNYIASPRTNKYTYASCTNVSNCTFGACADCTNGTGNSTRGIFSFKNGNGSAVCTKRRKYTYATDSATTATSPSNGFSRKGAAASWATCVNCGA